MCDITYFQHKTCKHVWAVIKTPCGPGMGFTTCGTSKNSQEKDGQGKDDEKKADVEDKGKGKVVEVPSTEEIAPATFYGK